jgi:oxygen-independent coproporphyrinogen-3 oxidase
MKPISVYVHIPFCTVKCGYCDFNAYAGLDRLKPAYRDALLADVASWAPALEGRTVATIAFGGGTPGEVPSTDIAAVITAIRDRVLLAPDAEISLEANPGTTDAAALADLRAAGVTRVSFGVQSFDSVELLFLDRIHSPEAAVACVALARRAGFESVGLDLIYALPNQSVAAWQATLRKAVSLGPDHISTYALTVEDGTPLARRVRQGEVPVVEDDLAADMYEAIPGVLAPAGYEQYELSNWARPGHRSRHNQVYWTDGEYIGIGAGAHGYVAGQRYENVAHPRDYIAAFEASSGSEHPAVLRSYVPDPPTAICDWLSLRLRLVEGFAERLFTERFGCTLEAAVDEPLSRLIAAGVLERESGQIRLTTRGRLLHAEAVVQFLTHLEASTRGGDSAGLGSRA